MFHLAISRQLKNMSGQNYFRCAPFPTPVILKNREFREELWKKTEIIIKLNPDEKL